MVSSSIFFFGPSPPIIKYTSGCYLQIIYKTSTSKSTPFLNVIRHITTILIVLRGYLFEGFGVNLLQSTAFGITEILLGSKDALIDKFSLLTCDTDIEWSISHKMYFKILLTWKEAASLNANKEWSVNTVLNPIDLAWSNNSPPKYDVAAWEWTICISSLNNIYLIIGSVPT